MIGVCFRCERGMVGPGVRVGTTVPRVVPLPEWARQVGYIVVGVCAVIVLIRFLWGVAAGGPIVIAP